MIVVNLQAKNKRYPYYSVFYQDPHGELGIEYHAKNSDIGVVVDLIYQPHYIEEVGAEECFAVFEKIARIHDECNPDIVEWSALHVIRGTEEAHHNFAHYLRVEMANWFQHENFGGDDEYYNYYPDTLEAVARYIQAVTTITGQPMSHYTHHLVEALNAADSPYVTTDNDLLNQFLSCLED